MNPTQVTRAIAVPLVLGLALGALGGWLWWTWWGPAPDGKVYDTPAGPTWYPNPFDPGVARDFSGTATYVVIGFALALLLGLVSGWLARDRAVAGLLAIGLASVGAAAVMSVVGLAQSPSDPQERVDDVEIGAELPGHLELRSAEIDLPESLAELVRDDDGIVHVATPYLAWPVGALLGYLVVMVSVTSEYRRPEHLSAAPAPQD